VGSKGPGGTFTDYAPIRFLWMLVWFLFDESIVCVMKRALERMHHNIDFGLDKNVKMDFGQEAQEIASTHLPVDNAWVNTGVPFKTPETAELAAGIEPKDMPAVISSGGSGSGTGTSSSSGDDSGSSSGGGLQKGNEDVADAKNKTAQDLKKSALARRFILDDASDSTPRQDGGASGEPKKDGQENKKKPVLRAIPLNKKAANTPSPDMSSANDYDTEIDYEDDSSAPQEDKPAMDESPSLDKN
jgi:hypothetical protein